MKNKKVWVVVIVVLLLSCLMSAYFAYQAGFEWGQRVVQRASFRRSGTVDVYGCGVDQFIQVGATGVLPLHELLQTLQPLPSTVNMIAIRTTNSSAPFMIPLSQALATNAATVIVLRGGEEVVLVHQFK